MGTVIAGVRVGGLGTGIFNDNLLVLPVAVEAVVDVERGLGDGTVLSILLVIVDVILSL